MANANSVKKKYRERDRERNGKDKGKRLAQVVEQGQFSDEPLTSYQLQVYAKATLEDFVGGKASVTAVREVGKLISICVELRKQARKEALELTSQVHESDQWY